MSYHKNSTLRVDPEMGRVTIGLNQANLFRIYVILRDITRKTDGSGKVPRQALKSALKAFCIPYSNGYLSTLLKQGEGVYWNLNRRHIFIANPKKLAVYLTEQALIHNPALVLDNRPGVNDTYLCPAGSHEQWEAQIYLGWMEYKEGVTISRERLSILFGRTADTLRRWEETRLKKRLTVTHNYAQVADLGTYPYSLPGHTQSYVALNPAGEQEMRLRYQIPNTYIARRVKSHHNKGQSRKVRTAVNKRLKHPAENRRRADETIISRGGMQSFKLYFESKNRLKGYTKRRGGIGYLFLGRNQHKHGIWEPTPDGVTETRASERLDFVDERRFRAMKQYTILS